MESTRVKTPDGINWYVERFAAANIASKGKETTVLIPSGEGDCGNLQHLGTLLASSGHDVISFDNPGFSRTQAPEEAYANITPELISRQIIGLLDTLGIKEKVIFFGNSSGGGAVLAILTLYPEHVKCGIVHEVPLGRFPPLAEAQAKSDGEIAEWCEYFFANYFIEQEENDGRKRWDALGEEYHARLKRNYVTWVRHLVNHYEAETNDLITTESLQKVPIFWTVGGMSDRNHWAKDFEVAEKAGIKVRTDVLNSLHFPYVSIPEKLKDWIVGCVEQTAARL